MMTERELRKIIREELEKLGEAKTPDQMRLDDARLSIVSLSTAADMLRKAGATNSAAKRMAEQLDSMVEELRNEVIPALESMAKGTFASRIGTELGRATKIASSAFRGLTR
jgi:hypothetical protein